MRLITLKRISSNLECVAGVLIYEQTPVVLTLERAWTGNIKNQSCIPAGQYTCEKYTSYRFGDTYKITNVPNRTHILFHVGNTTKDTTGCVLLGEKFGILNKRMAVLSSRKAMKKFLNLMKDDSFLLNILDV